MRTCAGWAWFSLDTVADVASRGFENGNSMKTALNGWLYLSTSAPKSPALTLFYDRVKTYGKRHFNLNISSVNPYAAPLYDAILLFARAATRVLEAGGEVNNGRAMLKAMKQVPHRRHCTPCSP